MVLNIYKYVIGLFYMLFMFVFIFYFLIKYFRIKFWANIFTGRSVTQYFMNLVFFIVFFTSISVSLLVAGLEGARRNMFIEPLIIVLGICIIYSWKKS